MADLYWYGGTGTLGTTTRWSSKVPALVTASIATTILTVTAVTGGTIAVGDTIIGSNGTISYGTVVSFGTGTGGIGTYNLSASNTVGSRVMWTVIPTTASSTDNVNFVATSSNTNYTVTLPSTYQANNLNIAAPSSGLLTLAGSSSNFLITGNFVTASTGISSNATIFNFIGAGTQTITTNGLSQVNNQIIIQSNGTVVLNGALTCNTFTLTSGTFDTSSSGNYALSCTQLAFGGTITRTLNLNNSVVTLGAPSTSAILASSITNLTFNAGTSQINLSNAVSGISSAGLNFYNVSFTSPAATNLAITGTNTFNTLSFAGVTTAGIAPVTFSANQTIGTLTLNAGTAAAYRTFLASSVIGTPITLAVTTLTAGAADYDFRDIVVTGTAAPLTGTRFGDCKGNSGITFDTAKTVYYRVTGASSWGSAVARFSFTNNGTADVAAFPLAQDTLVFPSSPVAYPSTATSSIINANYNVGTIDMSARTASTMTLATGTTTPQMYGDWVNGTGTTLTGTGAITFAGRNSQTITSAGVTFTQPIIIHAPSGSVTLQDAFITSGVSPAISVNYGTFDANNYNVTAATLQVSLFTNIRTVAVGSGTWTLSSAGAQVWSAGNSTNLTVTGTGTISLTNAGAKTFAGGSLDYSGITLNQGGAGALTIVGSNTFKDITNTYSATGATSVLFTAGTTNTFTVFNLTGTVGKICTLGSTTTAQTTLKKSSAWLMGANSTNVSNNTGLTFTAGGGIDYLSISYINGVVTSSTATTNFFFMFS